jgi:hypothetical protein
MATVSMNQLWRRLGEARIWRRIYRERMGEPLVYNLAALYVQSFGLFQQKIDVPKLSYAYGISTAARIAKR